MVKLPVVYSKHYDITLLGLEKMHPFDSAKYSKVYRYLRDHLKGVCQFHEPSPVSDDQLRRVHPDAYLRALKKSSKVAQVAELGLLSSLPNFLLQQTLLRAVRYGTGGTILGAQLALEHRYAINLSGGYHHAKAESGEGFCFFADIPLAIYTLFDSQPDLSVLVIDLDAHQGNGHEAVLGDDPRVAILDVYNQAIYPNDSDARRHITFDHPLPMQTDDATYLPLIEQAIAQAIDATQPKLIIYNAGTDIYCEDPLGCLNISWQGIIERDAIVFRYATEQRIPIVMLLSGGYTAQSAAIIGASIEHVFRNVLANSA